MSSLAIITKAQLASELSKAGYKIDSEISLPPARAQAKGQARRSNGLKKLILLSFLSL